MRTLSSSIGYINQKNNNQIVGVINKNLLLCVGFWKFSRVNNRRKVQSQLLSETGKKFPQHICINENMKIQQKCIVNRGKETEHNIWSNMCVRRIANKTEIEKAHFTMLLNRKI